MIGIIDYGCGNLFSVKNALDYLGIESLITNDENIVKSVDKIIVPGVGAFPYAMNKLRETGLDVLLKAEREKPILGICLGMQMLFETGYEFEKCSGLGLIEGEVSPISRDLGLKIPHIGWNELKINKESKLLHGINDGDNVYFVHSFMAVTDSSNVAAYTDFKIPALVEKGNVYGAQFHPEKSGDIGLKILENFGRL